MSGDMDTTALASPITALLAGFGPGGAHTASEVLRETSAAVDAVHAASRANVDRMYEAWRGRAGDAAMDAALRGQTTAATSSDRGRAMADVLERADAEVAAGRAELAEILRSFRAEADGLTTGGLTPAGTAALVESAIAHLGRAVRVAERVRAELDSETAAMNELAEPIPAPGVPAAGPGEIATAPATANTPADNGIHLASATTGGGLTTGGAAIGSGLAAVSGPGSGGGLRTVPASVTTPRTPDRAHESTVTRPQGGGVRLTLPDGSTVEAPNQRAADAVRNALSQVGTPYVWGGETPGVGMDCSGLTQWAYAQAGVSLPRLAQEQGFGHQRIGPGDLMPGDLAVWDGHVAMVIGNGRLVEAGDPVQIGPIRTENSGMRFLGFYRPTS
ncbi:NlpC/P60 family protein [Nocardia yunnanensis]|uniref:NlpC/P60 family protein n=1 Tax=Nocardia yunnanensis TaxID=2382165 RepID=A0A386ZEY4_9NOCA|nr:C40 family peptidase [Nocardia yunnanensis]AYF75049.1 NlpC/P60 family protein [Nocardia yunnanensis]